MPSNPDQPVTTFVCGPDPRCDHDGIDTCSQIKGTSACSNPAAFRMFWPGTAPKPICAECAEKAQRISCAMGFYLHLEPVEEGK